MKKTIVFVWLSILSVQLIAQNISTERASLEGGKVAVVFTVSSLGNKKILTELFSSIDNFAKPLKEVSGNIGENISEGRNVVFWDYQKEGIQLPGQIDFKITATELKSKYSSIFAHNQNYFRAPHPIGKRNTNRIEWRPNDESKYVMIELLLDDQRVMMLDVVKNTGLYLWNLSSSIEPHMNYSMKLVNKEDPSDYILSDHFTITKGEVPIKNYDYKHTFKLPKKLYKDEELNINWFGAIHADEYKVSLYFRSSFDRVLGFTKKPNLKWNIPISTKEGKQYQIKVEDSKNPSNYIISTFVYIVKPRKKGAKTKGEINSSQQIQVNKVYRRSSNLSVIFDNKIKSEYVVISLYKDERFLKKIDIAENKGYYNWEIPRNESKDNYYRIKITDKDNSSNFIYTTLFKID